MGILVHVVSFALSVFSLEIFIYVSVFFSAAIKAKDLIPFL